MNRSDMIRKYVDTQETLQKSFRMVLRLNIRLKVTRFPLRACGNDAGRVEMLFAGWFPL